MNAVDTSLLRSLGSSPMVPKKVVNLTGKDGAVRKASPPRIVPKSRPPRPGSLPTADGASTEVVFGQRVKALRVAKGWSQAELAARVAVHLPGWAQTTVAKTEAATRPIRLNESTALAAALEVPLPTLLHAQEDLETSRARITLEQTMLDYASIQARINAKGRERDALDHEIEDLEDDLQAAQHAYELADRAYKRTQQ